MQLPFFDHAYLLQSIGWAIVNSFWQIGILWLLYQFITSIGKKLPALIKHHLSIALLITSLVWFIITIVQNYRLLTNPSSYPQLVINKVWILSFQTFVNTFSLLSVIYLVLLCLYSANFFKALFADYFLQDRGVTSAPVNFRIFTSNAALILGIKKNIKVWLSDYVDVPSMTGFIKPVILLPASIISHLSFQQIEAILLHELAHIKRNDYLVNLLQSAIELILFFNPFALLLSKAAKKERENCCDDWVVNFQFDRFEYARALLILEEQRLLAQSRFVMAASNGKKNLLQRIKRLFNSNPQTNFTLSQKLQVIVLGLLLITVMFTLLPYRVNKPADDLINVYNKIENPKPANFEIFSSENSSINFFSGSPIKLIKENGRVAKKSRNEKRQTIEPDKEFMNVFINEELIKPIRQPEPIIIPVADKEIINSKYLIIIIEEQQSGKKQTDTYYFELDNKNDNTAIKPLIILKKFKTSVKKTATDNLPDSLETSAKIQVKKRITS